MSKYNCCFKLETPFNTCLNNLRWARAENLESFKDGFWLNDDYECTTGSDAKYWVPPGRIIYVEKTE